MNESLYARQSKSGAIFEPNTPIAVSFGNDEAAYQAVLKGVAVCDRTHWGRLRVSGADRLRFLHNQTTNQIQTLKPGQSCDTVFVTSTGRTLDLATVHVQEDSVLLFVSPGRSEFLSEWMDRYIFFADKVTIANETANTVAFTILGPDSSALLSKLGVESFADTALANHSFANLGGHETLIAVGGGLPIPGFTLIVPADSGTQLWVTLEEAGAVLMGENVWQRLRLEQGRPLAGSELTEDFNPLEAGLWHAISFEKGCYIGQETIARLNTYQGVKQQLWGLRLDKQAEPGTVITVEEERVGVLTSCLYHKDVVVGLGYIRTKAGGEGLRVSIGDAKASVVNIPFASRGYLVNGHEMKGR